MALALSCIPARGANELRLAVDRARDSFRLVAWVAFQGDRIVALDLSRAALHATSVRPAARRRSGQRGPITNEHRPAVVGAGIGPPLSARVAERTHTGIAMQVVPVDHLAFVRPAAPAPECEQSVLAHHRVGSVRGTRVVERGIPGAGVSLRCNRVIAIVAVAVTPASALSAARHLRPRAGVAGHRSVGINTYELVFGATTAASRRPVAARRSRKRDERQHEEVCSAPNHGAPGPACDEWWTFVAVNPHPGGARLPVPPRTHLR
jgi:hypothetical protein